MCMSSGNAYVYMSEIVPSYYRGISVGLACAIGRMGGICAPFISTMLQKYDIYPQISFGVVAILAILLTIPAKETFGKELYESVDEIDETDDDTLAENELE